MYKSDLGEALDSLYAVADQVLPVGTDIALSGESRELVESGNALYFAFSLSIILVFMVLAAQFESPIHPFPVLPLSLIHTGLCRRPIT